MAQNELITNAGASSLAALSNLKALNLSNTRVNADALHFFRGLRQLQSLAMYGCRGVHGSPKTQTLHCELPNLKCLRVDGVSDNDGTLDNTYDDSDQDEESSAESIVEEISLGNDSEGGSNFEESNVYEDEDEDEIDHDVEGMHLD